MCGRKLVLRRRRGEGREGVEAVELIEECDGLLYGNFSSAYQAVTDYDEVVRTCQLQYWYTLGDRFNS